MSRKSEALPLWLWGPVIFLTGLLFSDIYPRLALIAQIVGGVVTIVTVIVMLLLIDPKGAKERRLAVLTVNKLSMLSPNEFEQAVSELLEKIGYQSVRRVGKSGDLSVDITCRDGEGRSVVIQCKRYASGMKVGSRDLQTFIGMTYRYHRADRGVFVTTSTFTQPAVALARQQEIELVDSAKLAELIARAQQPTT